MLEHEGVSGSGNNRGREGSMVTGVGWCFVDAGTDLGNSLGCEDKDDCAVLK